MKYLIALFLTSIVCLAGTQSVSFTCTYGSNCPTVTIPNSVPFSTAGSNPNRLVMRVHSYSGTLPTTVANLGVYRIVTSGGNIAITNTLNPPSADTLTGGGGPVAYSGGDIDISLTRDPAGAAIPTGLTATQLTYLPGTSNWLLSVCPVATQSPNGSQTPTCATTWAQITTNGTQTNWSGLQLGLASGVSYAWLRWFSTAGSTANSILDVTTSDVADWEFEGSCSGGSPACLVDSVSGLAFSLNGASISTSTTPTYAPSCVAGQQQSFATGTLGTISGLNSQALNGSTTLTYLWSYAGAGSDSVTQTGLVFGNSASAISTLTGFVKGSVNLTLTVTDSGSSSTSCTIHDGAVNVGANDIVVTGLAAAQNDVLGSMLRWGSPKNRVPWYDKQIKALADVQYQGMAANGFVNYWDTFQAGTVNVSATMTCGGSGTGQGLVGVGTTFTASVHASDYIVIAWGAGANRYMAPVSSVSSDTCLIMQNRYQPTTTSGGTPATETGLNWGDASIGAGWSWGVAQNPAPGNYYDNVKAYRTLYERSGIDTYWSAYLTMVTLWWRNPAIDQGYAAVDNVYTETNGIAYTGRSISFEGLLLRSFDAGQSGMWTGFQFLFANDEYNVTTNITSHGQPAQDQREQGYALERLYYCYKYDPNGTVASGCQSALSTAMPLIQAGVAPNGALLSIENSSNSTNENIDPTISITVTNGSNIISCPACTGAYAWTTSTWQSQDATVEPNAAFVTFPLNALPANNSGNWSSVYYPTYLTSTTATLDRVYSEASSGPSNQRSFTITQFPTPGYGLEPFIAGIQTTALFQDSVALATVDPTNAAIALTLGQGNASWIQTMGYSDPAHSGTGGVYYYANFLNCSYPVQTLICQNGGNANTNRGLTTEALRGLLSSYKASPNSSVRAFMQTLIDQAFCTQGYSSNCIADGQYVTDFSDSGGYFVSDAINNKYLGQFGGWSGVTNVLAQLASSVPLKTNPIGGVRATGGIH